MATVKSSAENLTLNADGANNDIIFQSNGSNIATLDQAGLLTATTFAGSGASLTALPAGNLTGTVADARISALTSSKLTGALPAIDGSNLTGLSSFDPDGAVVFNDTGADVDFRVESDTLTHALFIEGSNGKIGINTDSPEYSVHMVGNRFLAENLSNGTTGIFMRIKNSGTQVANSTIRQETNGDLTLYQGTTSEAVKLKFLVGGGIAFNGDTAAANALDDYEEGTWTPSIAVGTHASMGTVHTAKYTKIGQVVTLYAAFNINSSAVPSSGDVRVAGFPFAISEGNMGFPINMFYNYKVTPSIFVSQGGYIYYQSTAVGGNNLNPIGDALDAVNATSFTFSYITL